MKLSVLLPLHTSSANVMLGANGWAIRSQRAQKERHAVGLAMSQLPKPDQAAIARGVFVTVCRVSSGVLDAHDNLRTALKHVVDAIATHLGRDDRDPCITWRYEQQKCERGYAGVRITIEDDRPGKDLDVVLGAGPKRLSAASESGAGQLPAKTPRRRVVSNHARGFLCLPWDQEGDGVPVLDEILGGIVGDGAPSITAAVPALVPGLRAHARVAILRIAARTVRLERHVVHSEELGGRAIVYAERGAREIAWFAAEVEDRFGCFDPTTEACST